MIDDVVKAANDALIALRRAERMRDFPELYDAQMTICEGRLDYLHKNAEMLYRSILPEYLKERDHDRVLSKKMFKLYEGED